MNLNAVIDFLSEFTGLILPIIAGSILALFISVPVNGFEKKLVKFFSKTKIRPSDKVIYVLSVILTLISVILVFGMILTLLIPEIISSSKNLYTQIMNRIPEWRAYLETLQIDSVWMEEFLAELNLEKALKQITNSLNSFVPNVANILGTSVSVIATIGFSIIIAIYITLGKEDVCRQSRKLVCAYLSPKRSAFILKFTRLFYQTFTKFLTGQCCEALILGCLVFIVFNIFGLPYSALSALVIASMALIPYVGALLSGFFVVLLTTLLDPSLSLKCLIVLSCTQFIENQFIYPRVVGTYTGLSPLGTLLSALLGAKIFGIIGIVLFIPIVGTIVELIREDVHHKLNNQNKI